MMPVGAPPTQIVPPVEPRNLKIQEYPGATTCIAIGSLPDSPEMWNRYRAVLWFADASCQTPASSRTEWIRIPAFDPGNSLVTTSINAFLQRDHRHLPTLVIGSCTTRGTTRSEAHVPLIAYVTAEMEQTHRARITRQQDGFTWQKHILTNLFDYIEHRLPVSWKGALTGLPAVVCGAGPSFAVSAPKLAPHASNAVIFAADSSLRALAKLNIVADFAVSVDVAKIPSKCLPDTCQPRKVVLSAVSPPQWQEVIGSYDRLYLASNLLTLDWLASIGIDRTAVGVKENCGATAIELARFLGCAPIFLFGMDLALDSAGGGHRHHGDVEKSVYATSGFNAAQPHPMVPGNISELVATHVIGDWRELDNRLASWPPGLVYNVNDRGARLRGTALVSPNSFDLPPVNESLKMDLLDSLANADSVSISVIQSVAAELRHATSKALANLPAMESDANAGRFKNVITALQQLFSEPAFGRAFGAESLRVMPHLLPPHQPDPALWMTFVQEIAELLRLVEVHTKANRSTKSPVA